MPRSEPPLCGDAEWSGVTTFSRISNGKPKRFLRFLTGATSRKIVAVRKTGPLRLA